MEIIEQKKLIRKKIKELKCLFTSGQTDVMSGIICNKVLELQEFKDAHTILLYNSLPDEVKTSILLESYKKGKKIVLPVVKGDNLILKEYIPSQLQVGYMNILEPCGDDIIDPKEIELAVIPGIAFDSHCHRLGRGKGYYDRLLPQTNCTKVGICYSFQIVENIPVNRNDIKMDIVITDCNLYSYKQEYLDSYDNSQANSL